jgi:ATP-dependent RNA helicase DDX23/PRP28
MRKGSQKSNDSPRRQRRLTQKEKDEDRKYRQAARVQRQQDNLVKKQTENQQKELQLIKDQYLGKKKRKKTIVPPSQKFKFNFDWEPEDDTSEYLNQLYANRANVTLQFGKWVSAGIDKETQKKANKAAYRRFIEQNRHQTQHKTNAIMGDTEEDKAIAKQLQKRKKERKRKEEEKQSIERLESRHWSQKRLEEMKERDWRILKEDFQITTKFGGRLPYPIRDWKESNLSQVLSCFRFFQKNFVSFFFWGRLY